MKILILNGSPRPDGNTAAMAKAFAKGAAESGHEVNLISVCQKNIDGCLACEYCHTGGMAGVFSRMTCSKFIRFWTELK